ncbi:MAG: hypothetical protein KDK39_03045 [Leptospiraceae bacterium]|nr:hypothetical protein [Leptospiraceae bacterium]
MPVSYGGFGGDISWSQHGGLDMDIGLQDPAALLDTLGGLGDLAEQIKDGQDYLKDAAQKGDRADKFLNNLVNGAQHPLDALQDQKNELTNKVKDKLKSPFKLKLNSSDGLSLSIDSGYGDIGYSPGSGLTWSHESDLGNLSYSSNGGLNLNTDYGDLNYTTDGGLTANLNGDLLDNFGLNQHLPFDLPDLSLGDDGVNIDLDLADLGFPQVDGLNIDPVNISYNPGDGLSLETEGSISIGDVNFTGDPAGNVTGNIGDGIEYEDGSWSVPSWDDAVDTVVDLGGAIVDGAGDIWDGLFGEDEQPKVIVGNEEEITDPWEDAGSEINVEDEEKAYESISSADIKHRGQSESDRVKYQFKYQDKIMKNAQKGGEIELDGQKLSWNRDTESFKSQDGKLLYKFVDGIIMKKDLMTNKITYMKSELEFPVMDQLEMLDKLVVLEENQVDVIRARNRILRDKSLIEEHGPQKFVEMMEEDKGLLGRVESITRLEKLGLKDDKVESLTEKERRDAAILQVARHDRKELLRNCAECVLSGNDAAAPGRIDLDSMSPAKKTKYLKALSTELAIEKQHSKGVWKRWNAKRELQIAEGSLPDDTSLLPYTRIVMQGFLPDIKESELKQIKMHEPSKQEIAEEKEKTGLKFLEAVYDERTATITRYDGSNPDKSGLYDQYNPDSLGMLAHEIYHHYQASVIGKKEFRNRINKEYDANMKPKRDAKGNVIYKSNGKPEMIDTRLEENSTGIGDTTANDGMGLKHTLEYHAGHIALGAYNKFVKNLK